MLFLDSADEAECAQWVGGAALQGVTTNATLLRRAGARSVSGTARRILALNPPELHVQVSTEDDDDAFQQAVELAGLDDRVRVKIPFVTAAGRFRAGLVLRCLREKIDVNITACTTLAQAYLALSLQPRYVSLLWCRTRDAGDDPRLAVDALVRRRDRMGAETRVLVGSVRDPRDVNEALESAADVVTVPAGVLAPWLHADASIAMARQFRDDAVELVP